LSCSFAGNPSAMICTSESIVLIYTRHRESKGAFSDWAFTANPVSDGIHPPAPREGWEPVARREPLPEVRLLKEWRSGRDCPALRCGPCGVRCAMLGGAAGRHGSRTGILILPSAILCFPGPLNGLPFAASGTEAKNGGAVGIALAGPAKCAARC
jgi:hypothetical protein